MRRDRRAVISGVYCIRNTINGKVYVGSSKDIYTRWAQHKHDLLRHSHRNQLLQRAWDKYGPDCLQFSILETTTTDLLLEREQYWYDRLQSSKREHGYNLSPIARTGSRYRTLEDLRSGRLPFTEQQFNQAVKLLCETTLSIPRVSLETGIHERTLYQIYFKTEYTELTANYEFVRRVNTSRRKLCEDDVRHIIALLLDRMSLSDVARTTGVAAETVRDIRSGATWKCVTDGITFPPPATKKAPEWQARSAI